MIAEARPITLSVSGRGPNAITMAGTDMQASERVQPRMIERRPEGRRSSHTTVVVATRAIREEASRRTRSTLIVVSESLRLMDAGAHATIILKLQSGHATWVLWEG